MYLLGISLFPHTQCIFQPIDHGISRGYFGTIIQMCVDIGCCREVTVSQPLLDLFHWNVVFQKQTSTAVSQIVEPDLTQTILVQKLRKGSGYVVGRDERTHFVYADVIPVPPIIVPSTDALVVHLLAFQCQQTGLKCWNERGSVRILDLFFVESLAVWTFRPSILQVVTV